MFKPKHILAALVFFLVFMPGFSRAGDEATVYHALALSGTPKYPAGFTHFDYVNPEAPKGGTARQFSLGTFDSFNAFITKGVPADGLGLVFETLTTQSDDEPFTQYGLVAEKMEMPADRSWIIYYINPKAKFHDGRPITADDVVFSYNILIEKGHPLYKKYYADVEKVEKAGDLAVKFHFKAMTNPELPLIIGQIFVLPKHYWEGRDFSVAGLDPPLGSGPYKLTDFKPGHSVTYKRVEDYWGRDLPVNKGKYNFDTIIYDYYRDETVALQAFKSGEYDFRQENTAKVWATQYTGPAFDQGYIIKEEIPNDVNQGMQGFAFNLRRPVFQDRRVRAALAYAFDFEWTNKNLFYGQYTRSKSYFSNSELASSGPPSPEELKILEPFKEQLPPEVFTTGYEPPSTDGSGNIRTNLRKALKLLKEAGWVVKNGKLVNSKTGQPFKFEILLVQAAFERIVLPFKKNLSRLGIDVDIRMVDTSQYINRLRDFDFDMVVLSLAQSESPGNEQRDYWSSAAARNPGSRNYIGVSDPVVDALVDLVITAPNRRELVLRTRALDRVLLWGHYVIPNWHVALYRVAYWNKFSRPKISPKYSLAFLSWWVDRAKEDKLRQYLLNYQGDSKK